MSDLLKTSLRQYGRLQPLADAQNIYIAHKNGSHKDCRLLLFKLKDYLRKHVKGTKEKHQRDYFYGHCPSLIIFFVFH